MSEPIDHHYLPKFYLKEWLGPDGRLCCFEIPYGNEVKFKWVVPKSTGFEKHLYQFVTGDGTGALNLETDLMSKVDNDASIVFTSLNKGILPKRDSFERKSWSQFLVSQLMRMPEDIELLKSMVAEEWAKTEPKLQIPYDKARGSSGPESVQAYVAQNFPHQTSTLAARIAKQILVHDGIATEFSRLHWRVFEFSDNAHPLLTSDRPIWSTVTFINPGDFLWIPISPKKLFVASNEIATLNQLAGIPRNQFGKIINTIIAQHAIKFVYSVNPEIFNFVAKHFASKRHSTLLERLAVRRNLSVLSKRSPSFELNTKSDS